MTSLETTNSFHIPQHTQPLHHLHQTRMLTEDPTTPQSSFSCAPPQPQIKSYFNPVTNETSYIKSEVKVHEIGIVFNYEIRHARDVAWEKKEGLSEEVSGFFDRAGDYFSGLFNKDDEEEEEGFDGSSESEVVQKGGDENLLEVEVRMVSKMWKSLLEDEKMTWDWEAGCAGLVIEDSEVRQLRQLSDPMELEDGSNAIDLEDEGNNEPDLEEIATVPDMEEIATVPDLEEITTVPDLEEITTVPDLEGEGSNVTDLEGEVVAVTDVEGESINATKLGEGDEDILDTVDNKFTTFSGTKLLGMTYQPLDYVKHEGCLIPDSTCTAIRGQVSVAYSGIDEYGVVQTVIEQLQSGMEAGVFIPPGSPALNIEFQSAGGTAPSGGQIISLNTDRGTGRPELQEEEGDLSQYGTLFVCLVAVLGAGFVASMFVRYKKRKRRKAAKMNEGVEFTEGEYEANLAMQQEVVQEATYKTDGDSSEPDSHAIQAHSNEHDPHAIQDHYSDHDSHIIQVELDVPQVNSHTDSNEVEISLTASKTY